MTTLEEILAYKKKFVAASMEKLSIRELMSISKEIPRPSDFRAAIHKKESLTIIAEIKKRSPTAGDLRRIDDVGKLALELQDAGANALSVLTDEKFFAGSFETLTTARAAVAIPALMKDFVIDEWQIHRARSIRADSLLLIAAILSKHQLQDYIALSKDLGMNPLVEICDEYDIEKVVSSGADIVGVNNRNLKTMVTNHDTAGRLAGDLPQGCTKVYESGVASPTHIEDAKMFGYHSALVGEVLMRSKDIGGMLKNLLGGARHL